MILHLTILVVGLAALVFIGLHLLRDESCGEDDDGPTGQLIYWA